MLRNPLSVPQLQARLQVDSGIIDVTDIPSLEKQLDDFNQSFLPFFSTTEVPEFSMNIEAIKSNIEQYINEGFSHLGFYFGFQRSNLPNISNKIRLNMRADKLNEDNPKIIARSSSFQFSDNNLTLSNSSQLNRHRTGFKNVLIQKQLVNFNHGLYINLEDLMSKLNELQNLSFDELNINLGFRPADSEGKWNCIHLIFRASSFGTISDILFSTFDAEDLAYDGPKLGIPPFGETVA